MPEIPSILRRIISAKRKDIAARKAETGAEELMREIANMAPARGFGEAIRRAADSGPAVVAEIKKASPSAGLIREDFDAGAIAESYGRGGAACLSVLTEAPHFQGADAHLQVARRRCNLPVLRKDFLIDSWQIYESRKLGADCVLLIVAALGAQDTLRFAELAHEVGLDVLVEVHDESELEIALETQSAIIGVNNRDLHTFTTDIATTERLRANIPQARCMITESGIHSHDDVRRMIDCGVDGFLVGEALMRARDPGKALKGLFFS